MSLKLSETQFPPTRVAERLIADLVSTLILVLQSLQQFATVSKE